jgi:H+/Cl- antiporter ClcA
MVKNRLRGYLKFLFDRIRNEKLKVNILQALPFWVASLITGLIAVFYARLFALAEEVTRYVFHYHSWLLFILTPVCFLLSRWLVEWLAPYAKGSGIPQVMASIELANPRYNDKVERLLSLRIIFVKICSSLVMVLGGGAIGREGPTIQIAGSVFRKINLWLPEWWPKISKRNMIMTGAAAGLAAAFNTPLGGIVFAVEELTKTHISYFKTALFTAVIIAGLTAQGLLGPYLYLGYPDVSKLSAYIIFALLLVAVITGLAGSVMSTCILKLIRWKAAFTSKYQHVIYIVIAATLVALVAFFFDSSILGSGKELMTRTLFTPDKHVFWYTSIFRSVGPILSFSTGAAGGIFAPALSAGASIGALVAGWLQTSVTDTNLLILCGMVGFLTGVTRSPFTSAILVLEMTDRHSVIFYLMIAGTIASMVSYIIDRHSFYDHLKIQYLQEMHRE